ncbi:MAG: hypothetical protein V1860_02235 [bacterium]
MRADKIFYVIGNHETYLGVEKAFQVLKETNVTALDDKMVEINGLQILGISYAQDAAKDFKKIAARENYNPDKPCILLYHSPTHLKEARELGFDLQLSGHTHLGQLFPFSFITKLIYGAYDYGLHEIGDFSIYTTNGAGTWGPPMRTGNRPEIAVFKLE